MHLVNLSSLVDDCLVAVAWTVHYLRLVDYSMHPFILIFNAPVTRNFARLLTITLLKMLIPRTINVTMAALYATWTVHD